jgi:hypothetical protein
MGTNNNFLKETILFRMSKYQHESLPNVDCLIVEANPDQAPQVFLMHEEDE